MKPFPEEKEAEGLRARDDLSSKTDSIRSKKRASATASLGAIFRTHETLSVEKDYSQIDFGDASLDYFVENATLDDFRSFLKAKRGKGSRINNRNDILGRADSKGWTLLHITANTRRWDLYICCLKAGADPRLQTNSGASPLHSLAGAKPSNETECTILAEAIKLTIDNGVDVNVRNPITGVTPLHSAVFKSSFVPASILLQSGASVDAVDYDKQESPLAFGVKCQSQAILRLLMYYRPSKENQEAALKIAKNLQLTELVKIIETTGAALDQYNSNELLKAQEIFPCKNLFDLLEFVYCKDDKELASAFFLAYHHFTTPALLLEHLTFLSSKMIKTRALALLKIWVSVCFNCDFKAESDGVDILQYVSDFPYESCKADKDSLLEVIHRERSFKKYHMQWAELQKRIGRAYKSDFDPNPFYDNVAGYSKPLLDARSKIVSDYLFLIDCHLFSQLVPTEFHSMNWDKNPQKAQNLVKFIQRSNQIPTWVVTTITMAANHQDAAALLRKVIDITAELQAMNDFEGMFSLFCGLQNNYVQKLKDLWEGLPTKQKESWSKISNFWNPTGNFKAYRHTLQELQKQGTFYIPALFLVLKDITFTLDGNPWWLEGFINSNKIQMLGTLLLTNVVNVQKKLPVFVESNDLKFTEEHTENLLVYLIHVDRLSLSNEMIIKLAPMSHVVKSKSWKLQEPTLMPPPSPRMKGFLPCDSTDIIESIYSVSSSSSSSISLSSFSSPKLPSPPSKSTPTMSKRKSHGSGITSPVVPRKVEMMSVKAALASDSSEIVNLQDILKESPRARGSTLVKRSSSGGSDSSIEAKQTASKINEHADYSTRPRRYTIATNPLYTEVINELKEVQDDTSTADKLPEKAQTFQQTKKRTNSVAEVHNIVISQSAGQSQNRKQGRQRSRSFGGGDELLRY